MHSINHNHGLLSAGRLGTLHNTRVTPRQLGPTFLRGCAQTIYGADRMSSSFSNAIAIRRLHTWLLATRPTRSCYIGRYSVP
ncbi:hypothetical protein [Candidatus Vallotia cooleyia]|uniref:hypothetical protein n=1 Tax=Candidatus Vallotiella adelgis TaxID=1177211 RepID=UPI001D034D39|nr:hypothetical protein [Candidatus Vallotia cooleyia]UDG82051.1 hypothetical protein GJV44_00286 [Candidatus Vallotia cooleyia]